MGCDFSAMALVRCSGAVLAVAVGVFALLKPKSKVQFERAKVVADGKDWTWTGRIDLAHPKSAEDFVLRVEETRVVNSPVGLEHREIRWRGATLDEAKTVMVSYHVQRNLAMTANFVVSAPGETKRTSNGRGNNEEAELKRQRFLGNGPKAMKCRFVLDHLVTSERNALHM